MALPEGWRTSYGAYSETFTYNVRGQLTNLTATGNGLATVNLQYKFSAAPANDGRLMQMEDAVSGEETNYLYDSLGRLTDAHTTGPQWGQTFSYDGFGNLTDETRVAGKNAGPTVHRNYDPATNRLTLDYTYDNNGNMLTMPGLGMTYNVENRLTQATSNLNGTESYGYDAAGLRLWKQGPDSVTHVYYNGLEGKPLADFYYSTQDQQVEGGTPMVYFAGKRVDNVSVEDRLGTAVMENGQKMAYFPYGELRSGTSTEVQFATYKRDSVTNLDYAQQRYYSTQIGRFTTPDPKASSAKPDVPQSWNRYSYALGDPVNSYDPSGEDILCEDGLSCGGWTMSIWGSTPYDVENGPIGSIGGGYGGGSGGSGGSGGGGCSTDDGLQFGDDFFGGGDGGGDPTLPSTCWQAPQQPKPQPDCSLKLEFNGVQSLLGVVNHAALVVTDSYGFTFTMEGFPDQTIPPWGKLKAENKAGDKGYAQWGKTLTSAQDPALCDQIGQIEAAEAYYSSDEVDYYGWGPNSNSFVHWLLESGWVDQYFSQPPSTPGWNTPLYGTIAGIGGARPLNLNFAAS